MQCIIEALRVSVFAARFLDYRQVPVDEWWRRATNADPEQVNRNAQNATAAAEGPFDEGRLTVAEMPGRVDWQISAVPARAPEWPRIGEWPDYIPRLINPVKDWLREFGATNRVAFGAVVNAIVKDRDAGYRTVEAALSDLGLKLPSSEVADFLLQFNKPVPSREGPPGMTLNRLARWSAAALKPVVFQLTLGPSAPSVAMTEIDKTELNAVRIEIDFSTAAGWAGQLPPEQAAALLDELAHAAVAYVGERVKQ